MIVDFKPDHTATREQHGEYVNSLQESTRIENSQFEQDRAMEMNHSAAKADRAAKESFARYLRMIARGS